MQFRGPEISILEYTSHCNLETGRWVDVQKQSLVITVRVLACDRPECKSLFSGVTSGEFLHSLGPFLT